MVQKVDIGSKVKLKGDVSDIKLEVIEITENNAKCRWQNKKKNELNLINIAEFSLDDLILVKRPGLNIHPKALSLS